MNTIAYPLWIERATRETAQSILQAGRRVEVTNLLDPSRSRTTKVVSHTGTGVELDGPTGTVRTSIPEDGSAVIFGTGVAFLAGPSEERPHIDAGDPWLIFKPLTQVKRAMRLRPSERFAPIANSTVMAEARANAVQLALT
jgi:hypothetical protein